MSRIVIFLLVLFPSCVYSQSISGKIIDSVKLEPIAFANISLNGGIQGTTSDIEGNFSLPIHPDFTGSITISHVSYLTKKLPRSAFSKNGVIRLTQRVTLLDEFVFKAGENPAFAIIRKAVNNRNQHDPDNLISYQYHSYNKFIIKTSEPGPGYRNKVDSLLTSTTRSQRTKRQNDFLRYDSLTNQIYFFMTESVTEKQVINPDRQKETVIGFRASGFKSPLFANVATDYQPFSFYKDNISLLGKDFLNPISKNSEDRYDFYLADTTLYESDTVFVIQYEPKRGKLITGLKGMVSISTNGYAIKNIIASSSDTLALTGIRIQQNYERVNGKWFPSQLNTDINFYDFRIYGNHLIAQHRSFIRDVEINPLLSRSLFGDIKVDLSMPKPELNDRMLEQYRTNPLETKEKRTYTVVDSALRKLQWLDKGLETFATKSLPLGPMEIDLTRIARINSYEGLRLGAGLYTSPRLSRLLRTGGYAAYGFKDKSWKYGGEMRFNFNLNKDFFLSLSYAKDIYETGYSGEDQNRSLMTTSERIRKLLSSQYDRIEMYRAEVGYRVLPRIHASAFVSKNLIEPTYDYTLDVAGEPLSIFNIAETGIAIRYSGTENFIQLAGKKIFMGRTWPMISFSYARAADLFGADAFSYSRYNLSARFQVKHRPKGRTRLAVHAGWVEGVAPYGMLYNGRGAKEVIGVYVDEFFQTMGLYEFTASKYASVFFNHNFGNVFYDKRYSKPELVIYQNAGVGDLDNKSAHVSNELVFNSFSRGYFESGLGFNNIVRWKYSNVAYYGLGCSVFYRYGQYQLADPNDNLVYRITFNIAF